MEHTTTLAQHEQAKTNTHKLHARVKTGFISRAQTKQEDSVGKFRPVDLPLVSSKLVFESESKSKFKN